MTTREKVKNLEEKYDVENLSVSAFGKEFQIYPWLKGRLFHKMIIGVETKQERNFELYWKQIASIFYGLLNIFGKYKIWIFSTSMERREIDGKYTDKLFDFIGNETGHKSLLIETRLVNYYPRNKVASKYVLSRSFFLLFEEIYGRIFLRNVRVNHPDLLHAINQQVEGGIAHQELIRKYLAQYKLMKFWLKILPNPEIVFMSVAYTHFGAIRAFKERGIEVVEMQHGVITDNHHAYNYFKKFDSDQFPDKILTIGKREVDVFSGDNLFPVKEVIPVGSYIIDETVSEPITNKRGKFSVLFTLQDGVMASKFLPFIIELHQQIEDVEFIIQPRHISKEEYIQTFPELRKIRFSNKSFYQAVREVNIHSTVYSTTAIEALSLGIPNILVDIDGKSSEQLNGALGKNKFTIFVKTKDQFLEAMKILKETDPKKVIESNEHNIVKGFKRNIQSFLTTELK